MRILRQALLCLTCKLHFQINKATGWLDRPSLSGPEFADSIWEGAERVFDGERRYQTRIIQGERTWWAFAPLASTSRHNRSRELIETSGEIMEENDADKLVNSRSCP